MIGTVTTTGHADDLIDALLTVTHGEVLSPPTSENGEWDGYRSNLDRRDIRRLSAAGLISSHGLPADRLAAHAGSLDNADVFAAWYLDQALRGLNARAERRSGRERADDIDEPSTPAVELPQPLLDYLFRLVCDRKAQYASDVAEAILNGDPVPHVDARWSVDVVRKVRRYLRPITHERGQ